MKIEAKSRIANSYDYRGFDRVATLDAVMACLRRLRSENGHLQSKPWNKEQDDDRGGETAPLSRVVGLVNWEQPKPKSYCGVRRPRGTS